MYRAVEATRDILADEIGRWHLVEATARDVFSRYGFSEVRTPIFEHTELFTRSVGDQTDIVSKEMYTFEDRGGRSLTLRPEGTAPVVRAYVENSIHRSQDLTRWYYTGPMFRYERKQKGRYRQFFQIGAEVLGSDAPAVDVETIEMVLHYLGALRISGTKLLLNSVGCSECRPAYVDRLRRALVPEIGDYCSDCNRRVERNIMRVLDCKIDRQRVGNLPMMLDHLCEACSVHFAAVREGLDDLGIGYRLTPLLVRGLDYYVRTAFEVTAPGLGAQNALLGGGRYDGLVKQLGGPEVPGFGFAVGLDRLIMLLPEDAGVTTRTDVYVIMVDAEAEGPARNLAFRLRRLGLNVAVDVEVRSVKAQMRRANRASALYAALLGEDELRDGQVTLRRLEDGSERRYGLDDVEGMTGEISDAARG